MQYHELGEDQTATESRAESVDDPVDEELRAKLEKSIADLDLSVRAGNCLESARIHDVVDLVRMTEDDLLQLRSFGKTSLVEVKAKLADLGLGPGDERPLLGAARRRADHQRRFDPADLR